MPFSDVVIIGSGIAALSAAKEICEHKNVIIITKKSVRDSNSMLAQGGIAAVIDRQDHWNEHFRDTVVAGCFHNKEDAVKELVVEGTKSIQKLIDEDMCFDKGETGALDLGREGAHSRNRILHAGGDATGRLLVEFMLDQLQGKVTFVEQEMAVDLIVEQGQCIGVLTVDDAGMTKVYASGSVILATGGCGGLFEVSSNVEGINGDGFSMAYRAGAQLADLEFIQFHPTMLCTEQGDKGLISEAVRGEGAVLVNDQGNRFMKGIHELEDLAPRDIVSRAIQNERLQGRAVFLDISMISRFKERFPTITSLCCEAGIRVEDGFIPVSPGAHFIMGGIKTNLVGETTLPGLYAVGEVAYTGVHGANRLASNSLLEGIVFGQKLGSYILSQENSILPFSLKLTKKRLKMEFALPSKQEVQKVMTMYAGIERNHEGLTQARDWLQGFIRPEWFSGPLQEGTKDDMIMINMLTTSWLIITSALMRTESRGGHFRNDYPMTLDKWRNKEIIRQNNRVSTEALIGVK
ncbi:L-aspartate oxidase [Litchfieldia salsa]|uniref:L-aspartate oxidase n=1 Tax=Litchfieldia salsa TaxID=930152 RepID=A0A1H0V4B6_9BACI|nr:L-aspartate oxidase [Litchfieldia salsa]SDP73372.1 L-aspartate oxidase [Litchfieldia salsa]